MAKATLRDSGAKLPFGECASKSDWFVGAGARNKCLISLHYGIRGLLSKMAGFSSSLRIFRRFFVRYLGTLEQRFILRLTACIIKLNYFLCLP